MYNSSIIFIYEYRCGERKTNYNTETLEVVTGIEEDMPMHVNVIIN
jgi:hypothetical protein